MSNSSKAQQITQIWHQVIRLYFKLQATGRDIGAVNTANGSTWGVLNTLVNHGPTTVPEIARMRPVSRQHIQTLANELVAEGLAEFAHNPRHRKSKLLQITDKGREQYNAQSEAMTEIAKTLMPDVPKSDLEATRRVLGALTDQLQENASADDPVDAPSSRIARRRMGMHAAFRRRHPKAD